MQNKLAVFDLEFTDRSLGAAEIVDVGFVLINTELEIETEFGSLVKPPHIERQSDFCVEYTGITRESLKDAPTFAEIWEKVAAFTHFRQYKLASWGVGDPQVLRGEYERLGVDFPHDGFVLDAKSMLYAWLCQWGVRPKSWSLGGVCNRLQVPRRTPAHRALSDALTTVDVMKAANEMISSGG